ncbi:hypothetical protein E1297_00920 [Roseibium sp. RKSG952]|nr:hypothetical protein [Roseibium sp. RKSG952]
MDDLRKRDVFQVTMQTRWHEDEHTFEMIDLSELLEDYGIENKPIYALALDNYAIDIEEDDVMDAMIALSIDGEAIPPRDKGPLWLMFDYNKERFQSEDYTFLSIWSLYRIEVD